MVSPDLGLCHNGSEARYGFSIAESEVFFTIQRPTMAPRAGLKAQNGHQHSESFAANSCVATEAEEPRHSGETQPPPPPRRLFYLLSTTHSSSAHFREQPESEEMCYIYMKVMKMYACARSIRQLINLALGFSGGSGSAWTLQQSSNVEPITLLTSATAFPLGSLCSNRFLIASPGLFYLYLNLCTAMQH